jgi:hypothetical protein
VAGRPAVLDPLIGPLVALALLLSPATPVAGDPVGGNPGGGNPGGRWLGPGGEPLPFAEEAELVAFLGTAPVVAKKELSSGSTRPWKVRLERDGVAVDAVFRRVDVRRRSTKIRGRLFRDFHDSYRYECAAYEVSRMLGIDRVPPCAPRRLDGEDGTMQLWIEGAMTEEARREAGLEPPSQRPWLLQKQTLYLFDALIYNFDRNQGNLLIDKKSWQLWFIDHTRSFHPSPELPEPERIVWCERRLWQRLRDLDEGELRRRLEPYLDPRRMAALVERHRRLVAHLEARIAELGEGAVLLDADG